MYIAHTLHQPFATFFSSDVLPLNFFFKDSLKWIQPLIILGQLILMSFAFSALSPVSIKICGEDWSYEGNRTG